jgi:hypothetical protein
MYRTRAFFFACAGSFLLALLPAPADAQYSNASLDGPWLCVLSSEGPHGDATYLVFDGQGSITDMGIHNAPSPAGSYSVDPDGAIAGSIWIDGVTPFTGQMQTDSTGVINLGSVACPLLKVVRPEACSGTWNGQFVESGTNFPYQVCMTIDLNGEISSCTRFAPPVAGRFFSQSGYLAGHLTTGESREGWGDVMLKGATLLGGGMSGSLGLDCSTCDGGSFELVRVSSSAFETATPVLELQQNHPNPFHQRTGIAFALGAPARVRLSVHDVAGRLVRTLVDETLSAGAASVEWNGRGDSGAVLESGVYYLWLQAGSRVSIRRTVLMR